jgi:FtsP/CotA-like multicopper oxidase with cupredoxin domain
MAEPWFTDPIASGEVLLTWREGSWYVESPSLDSEVKCLLQGDTALDPANSPERLHGTASKYIRGNGEMPDFLYLCPEETITTPEDDTEPGATEVQPPQPESHASTPRCELVDLTGSGDYVTVEAVVDSVFWIKKQTNGMPDVKGELVDDSVREGVTFVVNDGVDHPYLEEGIRFELEGVKDHYYSKKAEVQVMITTHTDFTNKGSIG